MLRRHLYRSSYPHAERLFVVQRTIRSHAPLSIKVNDLILQTRAISKN